MGELEPDVTKVLDTFLHREYNKINQTNEHLLPRATDLRHLCSPQSRVAIAHHKDVISAASRKASALCLQITGHFRSEAFSLNT